MRHLKVKYRKIKESGWDVVGAFYNIYNTHTSLLTTKKNTRKEIKLNPCHLKSFEGTTLVGCGRGGIHQGPPREHQMAKQCRDLLVKEDRVFCPKSRLLWGIGWALP